MSHKYRRLLFITGMCLALLISSCAQPQPAKETPLPAVPPSASPPAVPPPMPSATFSLNVGSPAGNRFAALSPDFVAHLNGFEEVPRIYTESKGQGVFYLSADGASLGYRLLIANTWRITEACIYLGAKGENGEMVAWLYPSAPPPVTVPGRFDGVLNEGNILAGNLLGPLAGQPLKALTDRMSAGETYINVHTEGFPGGEIRGQINVADAGNQATPLTAVIVGTVTAINGDKVSVETDNQVTTVIKDQGTVINTGDIGPGGVLAPGSAVQVYFDVATGIASEIELEKPEDIVSARGTTRIEGTVVSFSSIYIIITTKIGEQALVEMLGGTVLEFEDGTPATRAYLKPGVVIEATIQVSSRWATRIEIKR